MKIIKNILILFLSLAIFGCSNTPKVDPNGKLRADNQSAGIYYDYFGKKVSYDEYMKVKSLDSDMEWFYKFTNSRARVMQTLYYAGREKEFKDLAYSSGMHNEIFPNGKNVKFFNPTYKKYTDLLQKENNETITEPYSPKELIRISEKRAEVVEKEEKKQAIEESGDEHYTLMGFKEIRQDTPQTVRAYIKNEIYDKKNFYQKQQYYQSVIEPFIEGHDIRNEKDLYSSIALFIYDNSSGYIYEGARGELFDRNKYNKEYWYEFGTKNEYVGPKEKLFKSLMCAEYATYFKGIASDMYQLDSYTTYDQDDFLQHIWNTFYIDGEWWHSDSIGDHTFITSYSSELLEGYSSSDLPDNRKPTKEEIAKVKKKLGLIRTAIYENPSSINIFSAFVSSELYAERNPDNFQNNYSKDLYKIFLLDNKINERYGYPIGENGDLEVWGNAVYDNDEDVNEYRKLTIKDMEKKNTTGLYSNVYKPYVEALKRVEENRAKKQ